MDPSSQTGFTGFEDVVSSLEQQVRLYISGGAVPSLNSADALFTAFRRAVPSAARKAAGTFFTGPRLGGIVTREIESRQTVCDPTCGLGDLLLMHAGSLPGSKSLEETTARWGERLIGRDLDPLLVRAARARLTIAAASATVGKVRSSRPRIELDRLFPQLQQGDYLSDTTPVAAADVVVMNPPYGLVEAPHDCIWASGKITAAAQFLAECLATVRPGTTVSAILPDVLRAGSRYGGWRSWVESKAIVEKVEVLGQFDTHTGVDVFILKVKSVAERPAGTGLPWVSLHRGATVGDLFHVSVGPLVDYRTPDLGHWHPYIDVARATPWATVTDPRPFRRFEGPVLAPPFLVVRRTSSPRDRNRAVAAVITGDRPVAVENHLIVLRPKDGSVELCREGLKVLRSGHTNDWLNDRIRCRHLTVDSVRGIPWRALL